MKLRLEVRATAAVDAGRPAPEIGPSVRDRRHPSQQPGEPPELASAPTTDRASALAHTTTLPIDPPSGTPQPGSGEVVSARGVDLQPGARAGDYEIDQWLSRGGFGDVYRARHVALGGARAVKVLHADLASTRAAVLRFAREIEAIQRIDHPHVIRVEGFGELADGRPWFAMELLRGQDLADRIATHGRLSPLEVLAILEPLAEALDAVHARGIVHRDLKPSNVFLDEGSLPGAAGPRVVLLDFGVAKLLDDTGPGLTASLQVLGTPSFMAPEQIRGEPAGVAADVYALGAIVHAMLTGEPPFAASHDALGLLQLHLYTRPPRVSSRAPVEPALDDVVLRALAKQPERRHPSAGALLADFRRALAPAATAVAEPAPQGAAAVLVCVRLDDASLDEADDLLLADLDDLLPRASTFLAERGLRPALELGQGALFLLDLPADPAASSAARAGLVTAAVALHDELAADERIEISVCLHAASAGDDPGALLDVAAWVPDPAPRGVFASAAVLAGAEAVALPGRSEGAIDLATTAGAVLDGPRATGPELHAVRR